MTRIIRWLAGFLLLGAIGARADWPAYETRYYVIHTDLQGDALREASIRMTKMAEEYAARTKGFSGTIRTKLPFWLFKSAEDYYATGAPRESAGVFNGNVLMAVAQEMNARTWHIVQHEGFHQFADAVIGGTIPIWANEGLAEYFGEAIFTGDGFVSGIIPQWRLERIRQRFEKKQFKSVRDVMALSLNNWNDEMSLANYDQAWSMVQFLAHGDDGRYQKAFSAFMGQVGKGQPWQVAWKDTFGATDGFEQRWRDWWMKLPDNPSTQLYAKATTATLTGYLARAFSQGQRFDDLNAFFAAGAERQLKFHPDDWLPTGLLDGALRDVGALEKLGYTFTMSISPNDPAKPPQLVCSSKDGAMLVGKFAIRGGRVQSVRVD